ncbi:MAG: ThuA domain-containing protein [Bacillota bacterium]
MKSLATVRHSVRLIAVALLMGGLFSLIAAANSDSQQTFQFTLRNRQEITPKSGRFQVVEKQVAYPANQTAVIVCDVWNQHWCHGANDRLAKMLPRMNATLKALRAKGVLIVHAPSDTMKFYENTPQRALAKNAPSAQPPTASKGWNNLDRTVEPPLPIDDSDGGCDCTPRCSDKPPYPWTRQHPAIDIGADDAISDSGQEIYNLFHQRGIRHVLVLGVHTNMCVLGRSFGIRQMVRWGFDVALVRDLTDTMYNSRRPPQVVHAKGTDLVIEHIEKYWCPSILSSDILGDPVPPRIVLAIAEDEYDAKITLPAFAKEELEKRLGAQCTILHGKGKTDLPGIEALDAADLLILYFRRTTFPDDQLNQFKRYFDAGKPVIALRTSCHGFQNWLEFDRIVLGCQYTGHYGKGQLTRVRPEEASGATDPLLRGIRPAEFSSPSWLYKVAPLATSTTPLLTGQWPDQSEQCVAWTNTYKGGRVFFTSLGHPDDFAIPQFRRLLLNAVYWTLDRPIPKE